MPRHPARPPVGECEFPQSEDRLPIEKGCAWRRLAAILATDVVGYSRLMGEDEAGTLAPA
jgi:class 3 adenylate cyclase